MLFRSYFTSGAGFETLPIRIYSMTKKTVTPKMYALATIIFFVTLSLLLMNNFVSNEEEEARKPKRRRERKELSRKTVKRLQLAGGGALVILCVCLVAFRQQPLTLNVYNWGEYISDGSEGNSATRSSNSCGNESGRIQRHTRGA